MTIETVEIESRFSFFNIGTYGSYLELDFDGHDSNMIIEGLIEDGQIPENYFDLEWSEQSEIGGIEYDNKRWVNDLAELSLVYVQELVADSGDEFKGIITELSFDGTTQSPREYNFDTDKYWLKVEFDSDKVETYIANNRKAYDEYVKENWTDSSGFMSFIGADDYETKIYFILQQIALADNDEPDYAHAMAILDAIYCYDYIEFEFTPEWQAQLDKAEIAKADKANELQLFESEGK